MSDITADRERICGLLDYYIAAVPERSPFLGSLKLAIQDGSFIRDGAFHAGCCSKEIPFGGPHHWYAKGSRHTEDA